MEIYAAFTIWLFVAVTLAAGVYRLWLSAMSPKFVNLLLLPGTFVSQLGHVLGLLLTGSTVTNTNLLGSDGSATPDTTTEVKSRIPVIGPILVALFPLLACGTLLYVLVNEVAIPSANAVNFRAVGPALPSTWAATWQLSRDLISLAEATANALIHATWSDCCAWVCGYLFLCLAVRSAPLPGTFRSTMAAIFLIGVGGAAITAIWGKEKPPLMGAWGILNLVVGTLLVLLLATLVLRGLWMLITAIRGHA